MPRYRFALVAAVLLAASAVASPVSYFASPQGGAYQAGLVYQVVGNQRTVIYDFCAQPVCVDGAYPLAHVIEMPDGSLIGATSGGGQGYNGSGPAGVIYRLTQLSSGQWAQEVLYDFCPYYADCPHFGFPASIEMLTPNILTGVIENDDGTMGVRWNFVIKDPLGTPKWSAKQRWKDNHGRTR